MYFCGFCEESCPVDSIVETRILEYHGEREVTCSTQKKCFWLWVISMKKKLQKTEMMIQVTDRHVG